MNRRASRLSLRQVFRRSPLAVIGLGIFVFLALAVAIVPLISPYDPLRFGEDLLQDPSPAHLFGTDQFGRDVFTRVALGGQVSLAVSLTAVGLSFAVGFALGTLAGVVGGKVDLAIQTVLDALIAIPALIFAIGLVALLGTGTFPVIVAIASVFIAQIARVTRASVIVVREQLFVEGVRALGATAWTIVVRHIAPNVIAPALVMATACLGQAIALEATMSFLGLGVTPPVPSWGNMLGGESRQYFFQAPYLVLIPGVVLSVAVFSVNVMGDAIADFLNPRLRRQRIGDEKPRRFARFFGGTVAADLRDATRPRKDRTGAPR